MDTSKWIDGIVQRTPYGDPTNIVFVNFRNILEEINIIFEGENIFTTNGDGRNKKQEM